MNCINVGTGPTVDRYAALKESHGNHHINRQDQDSTGSDSK